VGEREREGVRAYLREWRFWKDSKKGWRSEGVAEMAVVRYSSTLSFAGLGLSEEDCAEVDMRMGWEIGLDGSAAD
jgi:hypothetical protein